MTSAARNDYLGMKVGFSRSSLGWLPLALLLCFVAAVWVVFLAGGMASVQAWLALMTVLPLVALVVLLATLVRTIQKRSQVGRLVLTLVVSVFAIWPAGWQLGPVGHGAIVFPFALASTTPHVTVRLPTDAPMRVIWGGDELAHNQHAFHARSTLGLRSRCRARAGAQQKLERLRLLGCTRRRAHLRPRPRDSRWHRRSGAGNFVGRLRPCVRQSCHHCDRWRWLPRARAFTAQKRERAGGRTRRRGARIGACGNSGHSSEPHVHIHAQRQDPRTNPINYAEGLPLFFRDHDGAPMPLGGVSPPATATGATVRHVGRSDLRSAR